MAGQRAQQLAGRNVPEFDGLVLAPAYTSWQKGGVENANGRLRRWLPRQIDIDKVSDEEIQDIVLTANLTPRKCLGFKTPFQAILKRAWQRRANPVLIDPLHLAPESTLPRQHGGFQDQTTVPLLS
jgi:hypothetical protein